jgi:flagellar biosynthesis chaperone FliJ
MLTDFKQNENDQVKELEETIDDLKHKLDKTEYIIQYKEKIWTYLEREIRKVVSEDSELMQKVKEQTKILTDCLATTKVSNVVKQNDNLLDDHTMGCEILQAINERLKKDLMSNEIINSAVLTVNSQKNLK